MSTSGAAALSSRTQCSTVLDLRQHLWAVESAGGLVGFVPTMGYLHAGHSSLIRAAATDCDVVVVSIFVNPLQFAPTEDLSAYPRDLDRDLELIGEAGAVADRVIVFTPTVGEMYPSPVLTQVVVGGLSDTMEGASRPTHFSGVATVVAKLFSIVGPCRAYFGEKDFQQLAVIRRMASDLSMPVDVIGCPIVRETDGLALSSRNVYLSANERNGAPVLRAALDEGMRLIESGTATAEDVRNAMAELIRTEPSAVLDYVEITDPQTLEPIEQVSGEVRLFVAATFGRARLIDNCGATPER